MPYIQYISKRFHPKTEALIQKANDILDEYEALGLDVTLRQLFYQLVARDIIPNNFKEYKKLQNTVNEARLAGLIDWNRIEDRTRNLERFTEYKNGSDALRRLSRRYAENKWNDQTEHVEVWVEKDALLGVIERASEKFGTPFFSCRGYTSQSEIWNSSQRLAALEKPVTILHLGDHDPSGVDMTRDIQDRMTLFEAFNVHVERIALNMDQIRKLNPPPNPVKFKDSRASGYEKKYGSKSWELDALEPTYLINLIQTETEARIDPKIWKKSVARQQLESDKINGISNNFEVAARFSANEGAIGRFEDWEEDNRDK